MFWFVWWFFLYNFQKVCSRVSFVCGRQNDLKASSPQLGVSTVSIPIRGNCHLAQTQSLLSECKLSNVILTGCEGGLDTLPCSRRDFRLPMSVCLNVLTGQLEERPTDKQRETETGRERERDRDIEREGGEQQRERMESNRERVESNRERGRRAIEREGGEQ